MHCRQMGTGSVIMVGGGEELEAGRYDATSHRASSFLPHEDFCLRRADGKATETGNTPELIDLQMHICS